MVATSPVEARYTSLSFRHHRQSDGTFPVESVILLHAPHGIKERQARHRVVEDPANSAHPNGSSGPMLKLAGVRGSEQIWHRLTSSTARVGVESTERIFRVRPAVITKINQLTIR